MDCGTNFRDRYAGNFPNGNKFMGAENKQYRRKGNLFYTSEPGSDAAGAGDAPAAHGFSDRKQTRHHKNQPQPPQIIAGDDDARDEAQRAHDAARHAPVAVKVRFEEPVHGINLPQHQTKANRLVGRSAFGHLTRSGSHPGCCIIWLPAG